MADTSKEVEVTEKDLPFHCPRLWLCTDNAAMSAAAGYFHLVRGDVAGLDLDVAPGLKLAA